MNTRNRPDLVGQFIGSGPSRSQNEDLGSFCSKICRFRHQTAIGSGPDDPPHPSIVRPKFMRHYILRFVKKFYKKP